MKPLFGAFLARTAVLLTLAVAASCATTPPTPEAREGKIRAAFHKTVAKHPDRQGASLLVSSGSLGLDFTVRADPEGPEAFHAASVGKLFTTVLVAQLIDDGQLTLDTPVAPLLAPGTLDGLFVVAGVDHQAEVKIRHLLAHISGVADYFADPGVLARNPDKLWQPADLLALARTAEPPVGTPGQKYHYSDTGFVLLGLVVEAVRGQPFHQALSDRILTPLGMNRTWMPYRSEPAAGSGEFRAAWLGGVDVSAMPGITVDWSGGGIVTTEGDLLAFQKALWSGKLVSPDTLSSLQTFDQHFQPGILSGLGLMQLSFGEFFFLLERYPRMTGHMGLLSTYLFYEPVRDLHVVLTFGTDAALEDGIRLLIDVLTIVL